MDPGETADGEGAPSAHGEGLHLQDFPPLCPTYSARLVLFQLIHVSALEAELSSVMLKLQWSEEDKTRLLGESEEQRNKVTRLLLRFFTRSRQGCLCGQKT